MLLPRVLNIAHSQWVCQFCNCDDYYPLQTISSLLSKHYRLHQLFWSELQLQITVFEICNHYIVGFLQ